MSRATLADRLHTTETAMLRGMTDPELEAIAEPAPWLADCTDAEVEAIAAGIAIPPRFRNQRGITDDDR
jgi:hypothetical protein